MRIKIGKDNFRFTCVGSNVIHYCVPCKYIKGYSYVSFEQDGALISMNQSNVSLFKKAQECFITIFK